MSARRHFGRLGMSCVHGKTSAAPPGLGVVVLQTQCLRTGLTCLAPPALLGACRDAVERSRLGEGKLIQLYFADLDRGLCICIVWDVARDFGCVGFEGGLEGLDRFEGEVPHRQKGWGRACHKTSHSFLYINPFEGRAGQATHKRDVLREVVLHVEDLPLAVRIQDADSDHVPSFKTVMAFPPCSTRLNPCVKRRVNWVVHLIRGGGAKWWQP